MGAAHTGADTPDSCTLEGQRSRGYMTASFTRRTLFAALAACTCFSIPASDAENDGWTSLFNGKDLTGWKAPDPNPFWKVAEGILVGENDAAQKGSMIYTNESYADFEFEAEARWKGEIDSGFMVRRKVKTCADKIPGDLQMQIGVSRSLKKDMTGSFYIGNYPEAGQAKDAATQLNKEGEWNKFRLEVKGDTVTVFINGHQASKYTDARYADAGPIGLQIHPKLNMKVEFRNLRIKPSAAAK